MRRRDFIAVTAASAFLPFVARAQQIAKHIGFLSAYPENVGNELVGCFRKGLEELGWTEGRNIVVDYRWVGNKPELYDVHAAELVVNLKTTKAIGLTVPATLLARTDKVIE